MSNEPNDDEIKEVLRRMREEFGERTQPDADDQREPPRRSVPPVTPTPASKPRQPVIGEARPIPSPEPQRVSIQLPMDKPRAVWVLLGLNVAIYILTIAFSGFNLFQPSSAVLQMFGWKQNDLIRQGEYWRLFTAMFLHGNLVHIFFNGYALYILGPDAERVYGIERFLGVYFIAGLTGSVASYALSPSPSVGASGAIFGIIGGLAMFYYINRAVLGEVGRRQLQGMVAIIVINLLIGFGISGVIDNNAHIGGLIGGALVGWLLAPRYVLDEQLFPPQINRQFVPFGWISAFGLLAIVGLVAVLIPPPL